MNPNSQNEIDEKISELESRLTGNLFEDLQIKGEIHQLKMQESGITPIHKNEVESGIECIGCGS